MFGFKKAKNKQISIENLPLNPILILALLTHGGYRAERKQTVQIANGSSHCLAERCNPVLCICSCGNVFGQNNRAGNAILKHGFFRVQSTVPIIDHHPDNKSSIGTGRKNSRDVNFFGILNQFTNI